MGIFSKSEEEKAQIDASKKRKAEEEAQEVFRNSPVGKARQAHLDGLKYYQASFDLEHVGRDALNILGHSMNTRIKSVGNPVGALLTAIENEGWSLVQSGFTFRPMRQDSRDKFLASGQQVAITGQTVGVYLFKRVAKK